MDLMYQIIFILVWIALHTHTPTHTHLHIHLCMFIVHIIEKAFHWKLTEQFSRKLHFPFWKYIYIYVYIYIIYFMPDSRYILAHWILFPSFDDKLKILIVFSLFEVKQKTILKIFYNEAVFVLQRKCSIDNGVNRNLVWCWKAFQTLYWNSAL